MRKLEAEIKCATVGDLLDELDRIAKDPELSGLLDSSIDSSDLDTFVGFKIFRRKLSDKSEVLDFELIPEED